MTTRRAYLRSRLAALDSRPGAQYIALALITLLAVFLRFYKLGEWSFWLDEVYTIGRAQAHYGSLEALFRNIPPRTSWIPLSVMITAGAMNALGTSEWSARLAPAMIGILSIPVLYFPIKRLLGPGVALIAILLLAVSPWHIYWSQNARFFTSLMLLYSLALFAFFSGLERDLPGHLLLSIVLLYFAASERLYALFMAPVVISYLLLLPRLPFDRPKGLQVRNLVILSAPVVALGILELVRFATSGTSMLLGEAAVFAGRAIDNPIRLSILVAFSIGVPLVCLALAGGAYLLLQKSRIGLLLTLSALVPPVILAALNPFFFTVDRYVFVTLPSWIILGAFAVHELWRRAQGASRLLAAAVLLLLVADAGGQHLMYYQINHGDRLDWAQGFRHVQAAKLDQDIVVSAVPEVGTYYMGEEVLALEDIEPMAIVTGQSRYWFVIDSQHSWWAGRQKTWVEQNCTLLEFQYLRVRETFDLRIYLCDPARMAAAR
jgi:mannosyltransferase